MTNVVWFTDPTSTLHEIVGGKAANLGVLSQAGFTVPPGFTVAAAAHTEFIEFAGLNAGIAALLDAVGFDDADALDIACVKIRDLIMGSPLPEHLAEDITGAYANLGAHARVAVRSSGIAEDLADASFAGMHDTYLDITGNDAVVDAVKRCWASLFTARATAYRHDKGFDHTSAIAVVVQTMVASEVSGVLFTANPRSAGTDELVINASYGLGEAIVGGIVTPDEIVLKHGSLAVMERTLGTKRVQVVPDTQAGIGTVTQDVPEARRGQFCLTDDQIRTLGSLGRRVQEHYDDFPMDIEWALADGQFYLLQARPITGVDFSWDADVTDTVPGPEEPADQLWGRGYADEAWTGATTPLMFSWRAHQWSRGQDHGLESWGLPHLTAQHHRLFSFYKSKAYYNVKLDRQIIEQSSLPGTRQIAGAYRLPKSWQDEVEKTPLGWGKFAKMYAMIHALFPDEGLNWHQHLKDDFINTRWEEFNGLSNEELTYLSDRQLKRYIVDHCFMEGTYSNIMWSGLIIHFRDALALLQHFIPKWYDGPNTGLFNDILTGTTEKSATQVENDDMWQVITQIRENPPLLAAFREHAGAEFFTAIKGTEYGDDFLARYAEFLVKHGHRGHEDRDIYFPRRVEDPDVDYQSFQAVLNGSDTVNPADREKEVNKRREAAIDEAVANIRRRPFGGIKAEIFKFLVAYTHKNIAARDNERHFTDRSTFAIKRGFLEVNRRVRERGALDSDRDFYFLTRDELFDVLDGRGNNRLNKAKIAARMRNFDACNSKTVPMPAFLHRAIPVDLDEAAAQDGDGVLRGSGTAGGKVVGRARVVRSLKEIGRIQSGDILITNSTDPGWTPVFMVLSGIVLETGGLVAHGALLAREYGFPGVQFDGATHVIPDGALIAVDGTSGTITILPEPDAAEETASVGENSEPVAVS